MPANNGLEDTLSANILLRINEMGPLGGKNPQLPRRFGFATRTSETAGTPKFSL